MNALSSALRQLRRVPAYAAIVIATLGVGIGASTALFTVVDAVLLRPMRFPQPERLVIVRPSSGARLSHSYLHEWRTASRSLSDMAGWRDVRANLTEREAPVEVMVDEVTSNYFELLGVGAARGRTFAFDGDIARADPEVVLSHGFWQRAFGASEQVIGQILVLDGRPRTIVGVMPEGLAIRTNERASSRAEAWVPFSLVAGEPIGMGGDLNVVARVRPGATIAEAQSELQLIAGRLEQAHPSYSRDWRVEVAPILEATVRDVRPTLLVLFGAVGLLLMMACANVATLSLSRATSRHAEFAVRRAMGATVAALTRQVLTETFVLALGGAIVGVVLAVWSVRLLTAAIPEGMELPRSGEIAVDLRVLAFGILITLGSTLACGLAPAVAAARASSTGVLTGVTRGQSRARSRTRMASALVVCEVAIAIVLLAGAGLLIRSFAELLRVAPGFQASQVLTMRMTLPELRYDSDERVRTFGTQLLQRLGGIPGVQGVGFANYLPMSRTGAGGMFDIDGRPPSTPNERRSSWVSVVGGHYFEAMGIPLVRGRLPNDRDTSASVPVVVVDEELARKYWPEGDPIGARLTWQRGDQPYTAEVIGVVGPVRWSGVATPPQATTYFWWPQDPGRNLSVVVRTAGEPTAVAAQVSAAVRDIDPAQPVADVRPMTALADADRARPRFTMWLLAGFAAAALLMSALGLHGVVANTVADRTREIGVRMAVGAQRRDVLQLVLRRGAALVGLGLAGGIFLAMALAQSVASLVHGITARDPLTFAAAAVVVVLVAWAATWRPARRATRIDPVVALRAE